MIVPDKKILFIPLIPNDGVKQFDNDVSTFLKPLNKNHRRDWFTPNFYRCLPLSIGNMQGFVFSSPFSFDVMWNGGNETKDIEIITYDDTNKNFSNINHVSVTSEFGHGIFTMHMPIIIKTPPGVNIITIAPPNFPTPGISPMTGVVETDNLRFTFTLNFKIDLPNALIKIQKDYPIMGLLPIPRYFCDSFELLNAYDIIDHDIIEEERQVVFEHGKIRDESNKNKTGPDRIYYNGMDVRKNKFKDHQLPKKDKK